MFRFSVTVRFFLESSLLDRFYISCACMSVYIHFIDFPRKRNKRNVCLQKQTKTNSVLDQRSEVDCLIDPSLKGRRWMIRNVHQTATTSTWTLTFRSTPTPILVPVWLFGLTRFVSVFFVLFFFQIDFDFKKNPFSKFMNRITLQSSQILTYRPRVCLFGFIYVDPSRESMNGSVSISSRNNSMWIRPHALSIFDCMKNETTLNFAWVDDTVTNKK